MIKLRSRWLSLLIALLMLLFITTPVFAITQPNTLQINAVWVYRNCKENLDQLYLIDYTVDYTNPPPNPAENITQAYLARLMNGTTELGAVAPYAYFDDGYDRGVIAIYFTATEATAIPWAGSYTMRLEGNPTLSWTGTTPPTVTVSTFDLWQDWPIATTQQVLSSKILWLADQLEQAWTVDLIETTATGSKLTSTYGENYFVNVESQLRAMAPYAFAGQMISPDFERRTFTQTYATGLEGTITGTPLDITPLATAFVVSRQALTAILYYGVVILFMAVIVTKMQTYKPVMLMSIPFVIGGAFFGVPLVITILAGFLSLIMTGFVLFYRPASA